MIYGFFNDQGRIDIAVNDDTIKQLPEGAILLTNEQWDIRFDLLLVNGKLKNEPLPAITNEPILITKISSLSFLDRFTKSQQLAVIAASRENDELKLFYDRLLAADFVDLENQEVEEGLSVLVGLGLITQTQKTKILKAEPLD